MDVKCPLRASESLNIFTRLTQRLCVQGVKTYIIKNVYTRIKNKFKCFMQFRRVRVLYIYIYTLCREQQDTVRTNISRD